MENIDLASEEMKISNALFSRIESVPLVNKYDVYQKLDDNWDIISGDLELIKSEGIEACNKIDPIIEIKKKGEKETEVQTGIKGHIIPLNFVIDYKLSDLKKNISDKENRTNDIETRINEILDNLSEDEKLEIESILTEENDAFVPKEVAKKAKELLKQTTSEGTVEKKVIEVNSLYEEQKKLNKEIKEGKTNIEIEAAKETENLTYEEITELLTQKWIKPIITEIDKLIDNVIIEFSKSIEKLSKKYEQTLKSIDEEIEKTEKNLSAMIDELTGSEFDMKGLEDFKSLFSGD